MRIVKLTRAVEKEILAARRRRYTHAEKVAARIIADIRKRGDTALISWTKRLDHIDMARTGIWVSRREIALARRSVSADFRSAIHHAIANVRKVAVQQLPRAWSLQVEPGVRISQLVRPIESIGCYVPGGTSTLLSTLIMTTVPAQVAGVKRITVVCCKPNKELLAAAGLLGITEIARLGGAQAIAALAYGTKTIPGVDKIFGPGNRFVTAAKQLASRDCAIDLPAGPTEAIVFASRGDPRWIAADLLAQAEHAPDAISFLVTTSAQFARDVQREITELLRKLPATNPANISLRSSAGILVAASEAAAIDFVNRFAPEHLSIPEASAAALKAIAAAGTVFVGPWAAQPLGDYASGSNHVLPTAGWGRSRGGLSAADFVKCISVQTIDRKGFRRLANDARILAAAENLLAHGNAVSVRQ